MKYQIEAADFMRLLLLASHLDTDNEIVGILMRVSESEMQQAPAEDETAEKPAKPES